MMHHHTNFDRSEILSGQACTEVQNLQYGLDVEYSKATLLQDTPADEQALSNKLVAKISAVQNIEIVMISLHEP